VLQYLAELFLFGDNHNGLYIIAARLAVFGASVFSPNPTIKSQAIFVARLPEAGAVSRVGLSVLGGFVRLSRLGTFPLGTD
jgi:hypothetical protein